MRRKPPRRRPGGRTPPRPKGYHFDRKDPVVREDGKPPCRWCKKAVSPPRRVWCGDPECERQMAIRFAGQAGCRAICYERDRGICAHCRLNTERLRRNILSIRREAEALARDAGTWRCRRGESPERREARIWPELHAVAAKLGVPWLALARGETLWQADHVVPVSEGGEWFDPSNLMTLCILCHRIKTDRENRTRVERRRSGVPSGGEKG